MFKKFMAAFKAMFNTLFGGSDASTPSQPRPQPAPRPQPMPEVPEGTPQDGSEIESDTIVVQLDEMDHVDINPAEPDVEFEEDLFGEEEAPLPDPPVEEDPFGEETTPAPEPAADAEEATPPRPETPARTRHQARYLWCLDNGHGKLTAGKRSPLFDNGKTRFFEYEFNRDIVARIIEQLEAKGVRYYNVVPEVEVDNFLAERVARANAKKSDLPKIFVSVHANAAPSPSINHWGPSSVSGIETWFFHGSKRGQKAASIFQRHLVEKTGWFNRHIKSKPKGQFYVLRTTKMTAVLTENGFYNNKNQAQELMKEEVRQKIADAHVAAILEIEENGL